MIIEMNFYAKILEGLIWIYWK